MAISYFYIFHCNVIPWYEVLSQKRILLQQSMITILILVIIFMMSCLSKFREQTDLRQKRCVYSRMKYVLLNDYQMEKQVCKKSKDTAICTLHDLNLGS